MVNTAEVVVAGAGVIGAAIAWRCAQRGLDVVLIDPAPQSGAWNTAAGMLAPVSELHYGETPLLELNLESLRRYRGFTAELTEVTGRVTGFRECGTVAVAWDGADLAALRDLQAFGASLGIESQLLTARELRGLEPDLAAGLAGGFFAPGDHQVDPRLLHAALIAAAEGEGVEIITAHLSVEVDGDRVRGVTLDDGTRFDAPITVLAAGAWSGRIPGVPPAYSPPVRPVKGQTLHVRLPGEPRLRHVVRGAVKGSPVYLVPRPDGQLVIGASSEEVGFDLSPRAGAVYELLRDAQSIFPELGEAVLEDVSTGLRPGSPDNAPLIGRSGIDGLVVATGHFRNGILLTPVTADTVADLIADGVVDPVIAPFTPDRFGEVVV